MRGSPFPPIVHHREGRCNDPFAGAGRLATRLHLALLAAAVISQPAIAQTYTLKPAFLLDDDGANAAYEAIQDACIAAHKAVGASVNYPAACQPYRVPLNTLFSSEPTAQKRELGMLLAIQLREMMCRGIGGECNLVAPLRRRYFEIYGR